MKAYLKPTGLILFGAAVCLTTIFLVNSISNTFFQRGYNSCINDTLNSVSSFGYVTIPVMTNDGEQGIIALEPVINDQNVEIE